MFYSADLLSKRGGKFYVIWILGGNCSQNARKINKSDIRSVNIRQTCKDLMALIPTHGNSISLRLSAFLMCGVCEVLKLSARDSLKMYMASLDEPMRRRKGHKTDGIDLTPENVALLVQNLEAPMMTHDAGHLTFNADTDTTFNLNFDPRIAGAVGNVEDITLRENEFDSNCNLDWEREIGDDFGGLRFGDSALPGLFDGGGLFGEPEPEVARGTEIIDAEIPEGLARRGNEIPQTPSRDGSRKRPRDEVSPIRGEKSKKSCGRSPPMDDSSVFMAPPTEITSVPETQTEEDIVNLNVVDVTHASHETTRPAKRSAEDEELAKAPPRSRRPTPPNGEPTPGTSDHSPPSQRPTAPIPFDDGMPEEEPVPAVQNVEANDVAGANPDENSESMHLLSLETQPTPVRRNARRRFRKLKVDAVHQLKRDEIGQIHPETLSSVEEARARLPSKLKRPAKNLLRPLARPRNASDANDVNYDAMAARPNHFDFDEVDEELIQSDNEMSNLREASNLRDVSNLRTSLRSNKSSDGRDSEQLMEPPVMDISDQPLQQLSRVEEVEEEHAGPAVPQTTVPETPYQNTGGQNAIDPPQEIPAQEEDGPEQPPMIPVQEEPIMPVLQATLDIPIPNHEQEAEITDPENMSVPQPMSQASLWRPDEMMEDLLATIEAMNHPTFAKLIRPGESRKTVAMKFRTLIQAVKERRLICRQEEYMGEIKIMKI